MTRLLLLCVVACGPKSTPSNPPTNPNVDRFKDGGLDRDPDLGASGTSVHLTCSAVGSSTCPRSYPFAADYTLPADCSWSNGRLVFGMKGAQQGDSLQVLIESYQGPGNYPIVAPSAVRLGATVTMAASSCNNEHTGTEIARSPVATCGGCSVLISDPNPNAPYPKALTAHISCPNLCSEDAYTCGSINLTVTNPQCTH